MADPEHPDGRIARGIRSRRAIVEAHTELVREGQLRPTAQAVADRAGLSVRTIWTNFADLEALLAATAARWLELDAERWEPVDPSLPMAERIEVFCARRADRMDHIAPAARSSELSEPFSVALSASRRQHVTRLLSDLEHTFGAEGGGTGRGHDEVQHDLFVIASWPFWKTLHDELGLGHDEALAATTRGFRRVLLSA